MISTKLIIGLVVGSVVVVGGVTGVALLNGGNSDEPDGDLVAEVVEEKQSEKAQEKKSRAKEKETKKDEDVAETPAPTTVTPPNTSASQPTAEFNLNSGIEIGITDWNGIFIDQTCWNGSDRPYDECIVNKPGFSLKGKGYYCKAMPGQGGIGEGMEASFFSCSYISLRIGSNYLLRTGEDFMDGLMGPYGIISMSHGKGEFWYSLNEAYCAEYNLSCGRW